MGNIETPFDLGADWRRNWGYFSRVGSPSYEPSISIHSHKGGCWATLRVGRKETSDCFEVLLRSNHGRTKSAAAICGGVYSSTKHFTLGRQVKGYSKSAENGTGELPGWRNFRIDKIKMRMVNVLNSTFDPVPPDADEYHFVVEFICKNEAVP
jgi:hypothetical protein